MRDERTDKSESKVILRIHFTSHVRLLACSASNKSRHVAMRQCTSYSSDCSLVYTVGVVPWYKAQGRRASAASRPSSPQRKSLKSKLSRYESATKFYCYELPATPAVARRTQNFVQKAFLFVTFCYQLTENLSSLCLSVRIQISLLCVVIKWVNKILCLTFCVPGDQFYTDLYLLYLFL